MALFETKKSIQGQSLLEIVIAIAIGWALIASASVVLVITTRTSTDNVFLQSSSFLTKDLLEKAISYAEYKWFCSDTPDCGIFNLQKGSNNHYYITFPAPFKTVAGNETGIILNRQTFNRYFYVVNVCRDGNGIIVATAAPPRTCGVGQTEDQNTQKIVAVTTWNKGTTTLETYVTRKTDFIIHQTNWSGGTGGGSGPIGSSKVISIFVEPHHLHSANTHIDYISVVGSLLLTSKNQTGFVISYAFDSCPSAIDCGISPNSIMWLGDVAGLPGNPGDYVRFQIASECTNPNQAEPNCTGGSQTEGWDFKGPDGTDSTYYENPLGPGVPIPINASNHLNHRYLKYKVFLEPCSECGDGEEEGGGEEGSGLPESEAATVESVIINWSP